MIKVTYKTVIYGAPGTGKTTRLINLIKKELKKSNIEDISYLTFTKRAANNAKTNISDAIKVNLKDMRYFGTIHSACFNLLHCDKNKVIGRYNKDFAEFCHDKGYEYSQCFFNEEELVGDISNVTERGNIMLDMYNRARILFPLEKDKFKYFHDKISHEYYLCVPFKSLLEFINEWTAYKKSKDLIDFVDMLELVLEQQLVYKPRIQFYDEQQDISPLLYEVYKHFTKFADVVYVSGDPNQSIFGFIGTKPSLFLKEEFDESIILPESHRLPKKIWDYSKDFILNLKKRYYNLDEVSPCDNVGSVCKKAFFRMDLFDEFKGTTYILCRVWQFLNGYRDELIYEGIPFLMGRGNVWTEKLININNGITKLRKENVRLTYAEARDIITSIDESYLSINVKDYFKKKSSDRKFTSDEFFSFFKNNNSEYILFNLDNRLRLPDMKLMALRVFLNKREIIKDIKLYLGTIHSVKGLEANNVILDNSINMKIGDRLKYSKCYDEEIRVFYVGMTRARENLVILDNPFLCSDSIQKFAKVF